MALEDKIASLEKAVATLTGVVEEQTAFLTKLAGEGKTPAAGKAAASGRKAAPKDDDEDDDKPAPRRRRAAAKDDDGDDKPARKPGRPRKAKEVTPDSVREALGEFLNKPETKRERQRLVACVRPILDHMGYERAGDIEEAEDAKVFAGHLDKLVAAYEKDGIDGAEDVDLKLSRDDEGGDDDEDEDDIV